MVYIKVINNTNGNLIINTNYILKVSLENLCLKDSEPELILFMAN